MIINTLSCENGGDNKYILKTEIGEIVHLNSYDYSEAGSSAFIYLFIYISVSPWISFLLIYSVGYNSLSLFGNLNYPKFG